MDHTTDRHISRAIIPVADLAPLGIKMNRSPSQRQMVADARARLAAGERPEIGVFHNNSGSGINRVEDHALLWAAVELQITHLSVLTTDYVDEGRQPNPRWAPLTAKSNRWGTTMLARAEALRPTT